MKRTSYLLFIFALFCINSISVEAQETVTSVPANDFLNSIGVNSAIYRRGENINGTIDACKYLGVRWIRTDENAQGNEGGSSKLSQIKRLYEEAGVKVSLSLGSGGSNITNLVKGAKEVAALGALLAIEGNNEPNNWGITYQGEKGGGSATTWVPVARLHRDLYTAVRAAQELDDYPVWATSEMGDQKDNVGLQFLTVPETGTTVLEEFRGVTFADAANCHNYFAHSGWQTIQDNQTWWPSDPSRNAKADHLYGNFGSTWNKKFPGYTEEQLRSIPKVTTETGITLTTQYTWEWENPNKLVYNTNKPNADYTNPLKCITEELQGLMYMSLYLAQFKQGWSHTAMYIMRDRSDENGNQSFGFYYGNNGTGSNNRYNKRLSAHYFHNFTTILADDATAAPSNPAQVTYDIPNRPLDTRTNSGLKVPLVHDLLLQKSNGKFYLIVWSEMFRGGTADISVDFDETFSEIKVYNPAQYDATDLELGVRPVATYTNASSVPLTMTNHPYILEFESTAAPVDYYDIVMENGKASNSNNTVMYGMFNADKATEGSTIKILAESKNPEGEPFLKWEGEGVEFANVTNLQTTFTMPANNVSIKAVYGEGSVSSKEIKGNDINITTQPGKIILESTQAVSYSICNIVGQEVANGSITGRQEIALPKGIYIVKADNKTAKLTVD